MIPDILGFRLEEGIDMLLRSGIIKSSIVVRDYFSPKKDILGREKRVLRVDEEDGRITLIVSYF